MRVTSRQWEKTVSELRIHYGAGYRVYFVKRGSRLIVLLCGGDKARKPMTSTQRKRSRRN
jgi:putative addiction module killer protein